MADPVNIDWGTIPNWFKIVVLVVGVIGTGGGGTSIWNTYQQGQKDQKAISRFEAIETSIESIKSTSVNEQDLQKLEGLVVNIAVDICKLKSTTDPGAEANCERIRYNYYNKN